MDFQNDEGRGDMLISHPHLVVFSHGETVKILTEERSVRFLLISGRPLCEPIARYGPCVMNTEEEIEATLLEISSRHICYDVTKSIATTRLGRMMASRL